MEEILHQLIGRLSHFMYRALWYYASQVVSRISEPSTVSLLHPIFSKQFTLSRKLWVCLFPKWKPMIVPHLHRITNFWKPVQLNVDPRVMRCGRRRCLRRTINCNFSKWKKVEKNHGRKPEADFSGCLASHWVVLLLRSWPDWTMSCMTDQQLQLEWDIWDPPCGKGTSSTQRCQTGWDMFVPRVSSFSFDLLLRVFVWADNFAGGFKFHISKFGGRYIFFQQIGWNHQLVDVIK